MLKQYIQWESKSLIQFILHCINDLKGKDIVCLNLHDKNNIINLMILCTGYSSQHVMSIAQEILKKFRNMNIQYYGTEGIQFGEWILIDVGEIIIHIMKHEIRKLYELEKLWI